MEKLTELEQEIARLMWVSCDTNTLLEDEECVNIVKKEASKIRRLVKEEDTIVSDQNIGWFEQVKARYEFKVDEELLKQAREIFDKPVVAANGVNIKMENP